MNDLFFDGRLTRDAEYRALPTGKMIANINIANNRNYKKGDGSTGDEVTFLEVSIFGSNFDYARPNLVKGAKIIVHGRLHMDEWQDNTGNRKSKMTCVCSLMDVVFPDGQRQQGGGYGGYGQQGYAQGNGGGYGQGQQMPPFNYGNGQGGYPNSPVSDADFSAAQQSQMYGNMPQPQQAAPPQQNPQQMPPVEDGTPF